MEGPLEKKSENIEEEKSEDVEVSPEETNENKEESQENTEETDKETFDEEKSKIYVIKISTNKEDKALDMIRDKAKKKGLEVYSIAKPKGLRGYILLEAADRETAEEASFNLPYVKGILPKTVSYDEIKNMVEPKVAEIKIEEGDIIEIVSEPFKKEKAKVTRVDKNKGEAVVTLLQAAIPIPVTVKLDNVRVLRREEKEEVEE